MAASTRTQVLSLYKMMLTESRKFPAYNYRTYALRRVRDAFRANRKVEDPKAVPRLIAEGQQALALIQRQLQLDSEEDVQESLNRSSRAENSRPSDGEERFLCWLRDEQEAWKVAIGKMYETQKIVVEE